MKIVKLTFALFVCLLLWGCVTAKKENMAFTSGQRNYSPEIQDNLQLGKVSVAEQSKLSFMWVITGEVFAGAIEDSLKAQGLYSDKGSYLLEVDMFKVNSGFSYEVTTHVQYTITNTENGAVIFDETVTASHMAHADWVSEASAHMNIKGFFEKLSGLRIEKTAGNEKNTIAAQLDALDKKADRKVALFTKLADDLPTINTIERLTPYLDWLQEKVFSPDSETLRYSTMYAFYLWKVQDDEVKENARAMILHAQLRLLADFSRCEKPSNSLSKYTNWYEGGDLGSQIIESYINDDEKSKELVLNLALKLEDRQKKSQRRSMAMQ